MEEHKKTDLEIEMDKTSQIMETVAWRAAYYRDNPGRFIEDFIPGLKLRTFQKIVLYAMAHNDMAYIIASRGLSKTYMMAMFGVYKCILYPRTHYVCSSYTFKQGREILLKITDDLMQRSPLLRNEIEKVSTGQNECGIWYKNGSWMRVAVAAESSRGLRSTVLAIDESRMVEQRIVDSVLRPMNSAPRSPGYLSNPEYAHLVNEEVPQEFYLSSAYFTASEMYEKVKAFTANFLNPNLKYFVCDLPYQLSIKEGILLPQTIMNERSEATFSSITFAMEREGLFYGSAEDALFEFNILNGQRVLTNGLRTLDYYRSTSTKPPQKKNGEKRILSIDIALLASRKHDNDASAIIINQALPTTHNSYISNISFVDTQEGLTTEELGLLVMRMYYQYECDYIAIDANGVGQSVLDHIMSDRYDPIYAQTYPALNVCNNPDLAIRCKNPSARKVVYAIKATAKQNNDMCLALRSGFQNGNINLLISDSVVDETLAASIKGYSKLTPYQQMELKLPYVQTSFLIDELINLRHEVANGLIKVKEMSGKRKDRYSSLQYNYFVVQEISQKLRPQAEINSLVNSLPIRRGGYGSLGYKGHKYI